MKAAGYLSLACVGLAGCFIEKSAPRGVAPPPLAQAQTATAHPGAPTPPPPNYVPPPPPHPPVAACRPRRTPTPNGIGDWMVWTTQVGWLHVGTKNELSRSQPMSEEIWGGSSNAPLVKTMIAGPFASRDQALEEVASRLSAVTRDFNATTTPKEVLSATIQGGARVRLRLDRGNAPDSVIFTGQEYDFNAELRILLSNGVSPRFAFVRPQFLVHATGMGTTDGPRKLDQWMTLDSAPQGGRFTISDGGGGTFGYSCDQVVGPFADNFAMVPALRQRNIPYVYEYGGGRTISTAEVVDPMTDHGTPLCGR
jgi:hypothetical protein